MNRDDADIKALKVELAESILLVKVSLESNDFDDVYDHLEKMIDVKFELNIDLDTEERNLISVGFRNYVGKLQTAIRVVVAISKTTKYHKYKSILPDFIRELQGKVKDQCLDILDILKNKVTKLSADTESMCYIQKLIGDYYRYAYDSTLIDRYIEPEAPEEPDSPTAPLKKKKDLDNTKSLGTSSVEATNDDADDDPRSSSKMSKNVKFVEI